MPNIFVLLLALGKSQVCCPRQFWRLGTEHCHANSAHFFLLILLSDIGGVLYGPWMRIAILSSIAISQIGFVAAYTIFVSQNLQVSSYLAIPPSG